jgi:arginyl-tRNA synthetase
MNAKCEIEKLIGFEAKGAEVIGVDYQCNAAFRLAKERNAKAFEVAREIADAFNAVAKGRFTAAAHPSGFINIVVADTVLCEVCANAIDKKALPLPPQTPRKIFLDYGGANIAKELHIGHLRTPIVGEALRRTLTAFGHKTTAYTHLGDWGLQMGLVLAQLDTEGYISGDKFVKPVTLETLNSLYPTASKRSKTDAEFYARAAEITKNLQKKTEPFYTLWKTVRAVSVDKIRENYLALGCHFEKYNGESDAEGYIKTVVDKLKKCGAYESEGCLVFDVKTETDAEPMPPVIIQKTNGGDLYATTDIATIYYRHCETAADEYIYITDARQELHFKQVFRAVQMAQIAPKGTKFVHVSHGSVNGADGKPFKTRAGDSIKLQDIIDVATKCAYEKMKTKDMEAAQKIGISALKFADLSNTVRKDYIFDIDKATSFDGRTGPYLLYTVARINSILKKGGVDIKTVSKSLSPTPQTRDIFLAVLKLTDAFTIAVQTYSLNPIADAVYNLAAQFNLFYAKETIAGNAQNTAVAVLVQTAMRFALDALAIDTVDSM